MLGRGSARPFVLSILSFMVISEGIVFVYNVMRTSQNVSNIEIHKRSIRASTDDFRALVRQKRDTVPRYPVASAYGFGPKALCPEVPPDIENSTVILHDDVLTIEQTELIHREVRDGGSWEPENCTARNEVAILVPYRDRELHLKIFLRHMHPFLQKQQISYTIFIVEMTGTRDFNRGFLFNVGFLEASKIKNFQCFILHDVDLVPENYQNIYSCYLHPRLLAVTRSNMKYKVAYKDYFGGVCAMTKSDIQIVNGFSNRFYGWGGEDDDLANRILQNNMEIYRLEPETGSYKSAFHTPEKKNPKRKEIMKFNKKQRFQDGLTTLRYKIYNVKKLKLYTWILVEPVDF